MSPKEHFQGIKILHIAFVMGLVLFLGISIFLNYSGIAPFMDDELIHTTFGVLSIAVAIPGVLVGVFVFNKIVGKIKETDSIDEKLTTFRTANLIRLAAIEGVALMSITGYMATGNNYSLIAGVVLIAIMAFLKPSKEELKKSLKLTPSELMEIDKI